MRILRAWTVTLLAGTLLCATGAQAQPRAGKKQQDRAAAEAPEGKRTTAEQLQELRGKVDEALRGAAEASTALKALQEVQRQLTELRQANARQRDVLRGHQEARKKIDEYERRIGDSELQLAALRMQLAGRGQIAGYHEGFYIQTPNRHFQLRVNGLLQLGYVGKIFSDSRTYSESGDNESTFLVRRAALAASGHLFMQQLGYRLELDFGSVDPGILLDAYADVAAHRLIGLRVGRMKVPFGRQLLQHSSRLQFVDRLGATTAFAPGWDLGAMLYGAVHLGRGALSYQLGLFNGAGQHLQKNDNIDFLYAARVVYEPLGPLFEGEGDPELSKLRVAIGASFFYNLSRSDIALRKGTTDAATIAALQDKDGDGKIDNVGVYAVGVDLAVRLSGMSLQSEFFFRKEDPGKIGSDASLWGSYWGIFAQGGFFPFHGPAEVALRYGYWEPSDYGASRAALLPHKMHELGAVVTLLTWRRNLKWQVEYDHQWRRDLRSVTKTLDAANVNQVQLQVQAAF